jgi:hypothetical protein
MAQRQRGSARPEQVIELAEINLNHDVVAPSASGRGDSGVAIEIKHASPARARLNEVERPTGFLPKDLDDTR